MTLAEECVERGAGLLDREVPGWFRKIDLENFDVENPERCVTKQVFGGYSEGARRLGLKFPNLGSHGFAEHVERQDGFMRRSYYWNRPGGELGLTTLWMLQVKERRMQDERSSNGSS